MIKKNLVLTLCLLICYLSETKAQTVTGKPNEQHLQNGGQQNDFSKLHIGLGLGMDYGGIGFKVAYLPIKYLGVFGGVGYNIVSIGVNAGVQFRPLPDKKIQPLLMAMYGYNGVIQIKNNSYSSQYGLDGISKAYYGPSIGAGGELKVGKRGNRLYLGLFLPFRSKSFHDNYDLLKNSPYVNMETDVLPVTFSFGFNWVL